MPFGRHQPSTPADLLVLLRRHPAPFEQLSKLSTELRKHPETSVIGSPLIAFETVSKTRDSRSLSETSAAP